MKLILLLFFFMQVASGSVIEAPFPAYDYEQNPSDMEWRHIETEHFDVIFPEEIEEDAQRAAQLLEKSYRFVARSLEVAPHRIPLILQNQSMQSNGFVTLAPRRSEFYITPAIDPELSNTEWIKTLTIHEFRHVVQLQKTRRGFNRWLEVFLGEVGQAVGLGLTVPPWFLEGDAVGIETALTRGGRGRLPLFDRDLRTLLLSGKNYSYDKAHLGSYEDYIPNHYYYGYFYTSWLRNEYGDLFLSNVVSKASENSYNPLTFYNTIDNMTGERFEKFYAKVMKDLISEWKKRADKLTPTPYEVKNLSKRFGWTNYYYPQKTKEGQIVALKKGLSYIDRFVIIDGKKEKTLFYPAPLINEYPFKVRNNKLAITEWEFDPRWGYRDYSRIKVYDLDKKKFVLDKRKTKGRLAILDQEGSRLCFVEWDDHQEQFIVLLNAKGKEILRIPYPKEEVITSLDWLNESEIVFVTKDRMDGKGISKINLNSRKTETLLEKSLVNIGGISVEEGHLFFESPESGIDNIFLLTKEGTRQVTSALFGAYAPELINNKLIYNDYTAEGMNVVEKTLQWETEQKSSDSFYPIYEKFAVSENFRALDTSYSDTQKLTSKKYSQPDHAVNLHSWVLLAPPLGNSITVIGYSRDILNKFTTSVGGEYNLNEQTAQAFAGAAWTHLYPVFDIRAAYGSRRQDIDIGTDEIENRWEEGTFEAGISVPWKYLQGRFVHAFTSRAFSKIIKVTNKVSDDVSDVNDGSLFSPGIDLSYSFTSRLARRDLYPEWGLLVQGHAEEGKDITGLDQKGSIQSVDSRLYLPGLWYHHSFFHQFSYERQRDDFYQYASYIFYPRGTKSIFLQEFTKYSANYSMPLFYPDYNLSRYIYFKRISLNLFYDELNGRYYTIPYHAASAGWEAIFEMNFLRFFFPFSIGVRGSYVIDGIERDNNYEIFLASVLGVF